MSEFKEQNKQSGINQIINDIKNEINEFGCMPQISSGDRKIRYDGLSGKLDELRKILHQQESELKKVFEKISELATREAVLNTRINYYLKTFPQTNTSTDDSELELVSVKLTNERLKKNELLNIIGEIELHKKSAKTFLSGINKSVITNYDN